MITSHTHSHTRADAGIALLVAVIFMSVILAIGLTLSSLGYKQVLLASSTVASQNAFYAADAALECVLYADQQQGAFLYAPGFHNPATSITCNGTSVPVTPGAEVNNSGNTLFWYRYEVNNIPLGDGCADVRVYKPYPTVGTTYLFASGYDNSTCTVSSRTTIRGVEMHYSTI